MIALRLSVLACGFFAAASAADAPALPTRAEVAKLITAGEQWLLTQQQPSGAFMPGNRFVLGVTELAVEALAAPPRSLPVDDPHLAKGIACIRTYIRPDGGVYDPKEGLSVYGTALAILAFKEADQLDPAFVKKAQEHLFGLQNLDPKSPFFGGMGYDADVKAGFEDLHNTSAALVALKASGVPASDPRMQAVLQFMTMCQDTRYQQGEPPALGGLPKPPTGAALARPNLTDSGGGMPRPVPAELEDAKGRGADDDRKPDVYGSPSYTLLTSYLTLDLKPGDPRVDSVLRWIHANYGFDANPGLPLGKERDGLFYYQTIASKTFALIDPAVASPAGHDWRADLYHAIAKEAKPLPGGMIMWANSSKRWGEFLPHLSTAYVVRALKRIHEALPK
jgi:hypothetical protein